MEILEFTGNMQHTTTRLISTRKNIPTIENPHPFVQNFGTGFFFDFGIPDLNHHLKVIVTNRHVVVDAILLNFVINETDSLGHRTEVQHTLSMNQDNLKTNVFYHPDPDVDLCIVDISYIYKDLKKSGITLFMRPLSFDEVPSRDDVKALKALEQVVMIGYPAALWDEHNNLPIMRTGDTASHVAYDYKGKEDFLVNIPAYHGSSGSPLVMLKQEYVTRSGELFVKNNCLLLGIQKAIPHIVHPDGSIYANLGIFVKSYRLYDFIPLIEEAYQQDIVFLQGKQK